MQIALLALLLIACCALPAPAASLDQLTPYLSGRYFTWREFSAGRQILRESGPLYAGGLLVGALFPLTAPSALTLRLKGELSGGYVDYSGETQAPDSVPVDTSVSYFGVGQELDLGYRYTADSWNLEPFGGVGYRWWLRGLQNSTSATGGAVTGYTESWQMAYLRLGARGTRRVGSGVSLFAEGGARYPFYVGNSVNFAGTGVATFRPQGEWSGFAEAGASYRHLRLSLSYEALRLSASSLVRVGSKNFFQPESRSDVLGLNLGWSF